MSQLNSKSSDIIKKVSRELLNCEVGNRIPTIPYFTKKLKVGSGTVDRVLSSLKSDLVLKLDSRGKMGTFMLERDFAKLWQAADFGVVIGLLPLPNAREYEGLATGLTQIFNSNGITFSLNFKNGGRERLNSLLDDRCEFTVLSRSASESALGAYPELDLVMEFSSDTYYSDFIRVRSSSSEKDDSQWTIGVDFTSYDHVVLSDNEFPDNDKIKVHYIHIPYLIADGKIDAAVCHNKSVIPFDLVDAIATSPIQKPLSYEYLKQASSAAIVYKKSRKEIFMLFKEICNKERIEEIQRGVIQRTIIPTY